MKNIRTSLIGIFTIISIFIFLSNKKAETGSNKNEGSIIESSISNNDLKSKYIIKGSSIDMVKGRRPYELNGRVISTKHFVVRETKPENPFGPHKHEQSELWFIIKGKGKLLLNGVEYDVEENDLIILDPWIEHGLSTDGELTWICLG